ncbi:MAG: immunoglobulin domain-containing protein, partial [Bacteroidales bacterium]
MADTAEFVGNSGVRLRYNNRETTNKFTEEAKSSGNILSERFLIFPSWFDPILHQSDLSFFKEINKYRRNFSSPTGNIIRTKSFANNAFISGNSYMGSRHRPGFSSLTHSFSGFGTRYIQDIDFLNFSAFPSNGMGDSKVDQRDSENPELYWVNGSGNWDDPSHWAKSSGGPGGAGVPTRNDDVIIDHNSFSDPGQSIKIKGEAACKDLVWKNVRPQGGLNSRHFIFNKWTGAELKVYGSLKLPEKLSNEYYGDLLMKAENENNTIDIQPELHSDVIFDGPGGGWSLQNDLNTSGDIQLQRGALNTNDYEVTGETFKTTGTERRSLDMGRSDVTVSRWDFKSVENLDFDAGESSIFLQGENASENFNSGGLEYNTFSSASLKNGGSDVELTAYTDSVTCNGGSDGIIYMLASGGSGDYLYEVRDSDDNLIEDLVTSSDSVAFTGYSAGTYNLYLYDDNDHSNWDGTSRTVEEPDAVVIDSVTCVQALSCYNSSDAALEAHPSGGTPPYVEYTWEVNGTIVGSDSSVVTGIARDDIVTVSVKDANGCESGDFNLIFNETYYGDSIPSEISISVDNVEASCALTNDGEIQLSASGGTGDKDFQLVATSTGNTIPSSGWDEDGDFTGLAPDTYETYAIDENDCVKQGDDVVVDSVTQTEITQDPVNETACEGSMAEFSVEADGFSLTYTWQSSPDGSSNWSDVSGSNISGEDTENLTIDPVSDSDELFYRVYVVGDCGEEYSDTVSLTVQDTVTITSHPSDETVCEGEDATFNVSADGESPLSYQWYTNASGSWSSISGATSDSYTVSDVSNNDAGDYRVEVSNTCGTRTSDAATLSVNDTIDITDQPNDQTGCEGSDITFSSTVNGDVTGYQWETDAGGSWSDISGATNTDLTLTDIENADEGNYRLKIQGVCGDDTTNTVSLAVSDTVSITSHPSDETVCEGEDATF